MHAEEVLQLAQELATKTGTNKRASNLLCLWCPLLFLYVGVEIDTRDVFASARSRGAPGGEFAEALRRGRERQESSQTIADLSFNAENRTKTRELANYYLWCMFFVFQRRRPSGARQPAAPHLGAHGPGAPPRRWPWGGAVHGAPSTAMIFRENHSSRTTCLTRAFFKRGKRCSKFN